MYHSDIYHEGQFIVVLLIDSDSVLLQLDEFSSSLKLSR